MASARIAQVGAGQGACRLFRTDTKNDLWFPYLLSSDEDFLIFVSYKLHGLISFTPASINGISSRLATTISLARAMPAI